MNITESVLCIGNYVIFGTKINFIKWLCWTGVDDFVYVQYIKLVERIQNAFSGAKKLQDRCWYDFCIVYL